VKWPTSDTAARLSRLALAATGLVAAVNFTWQLGSSSYYVDEVGSVSTSLAPLSHLLHTVGALQVSPPAYYLFAHEWLLRLGWGHEWVARLPSALAGVMLVGAVYWLCSLLSERHTTRLAAAALAALSPFVLEYAQLAEPYAIVALAVTVAVAAAIRADRDGGRRWLIASLAASVLAIFTHYTAMLAIAPLCLFVATRTAVPRRWRLGFPTVCLLSALALVPLLITQHHAHPGRPGVAVSGAVSSRTIAGLLGVPFAGRVQALEALGIAVMAVAVAVMVAAVVRRRAPAGRRLVVALAVGEPLSLFLLSVIGGRSFFGHVMLTRYAAVAAPLLIATVALALETLPGAGAVVLGLCAGLVAVTGTLQSHRPSSFFLDARGAITYVQRHALPGDAVLATSDVDAQLPLTHYGIDRWHPQWFSGDDEGTMLRREKARTWLIAETHGVQAPSSAAALAYERLALRPFGDRPLATRSFPGIPGLVVVLIAPAQRRTIRPG